MRFIDTRALVDDRPHEGVFRVHRDVFADAALFELEMENVFGKTWVFLGTRKTCNLAIEFSHCFESIVRCVAPPLT